MASTHCGLDPEVVKGRMTDCVVEDRAWQTVSGLLRVLGLHREEALMVLLRHDHVRDSRWQRILLFILLLDRLDRRCDLR